jgi:hypothetical protein
MTAKLAAQFGLLLLLAVCGYAHRQRRIGGLDRIMTAGLVVNLLGVAGLWLRTDKPYEGPTLIGLGTRHGVTVADLLVVVPFALAWRLSSDQGLRVSALLKRR